MIVRPVDGGTLMISQNDHARLSGIFAARWGNAAFAVPQPNESAVRAAAFHDCGWYSYDTRPRFEAGDGTTPTFLKVPFDAREIAAHQEGLDWLWAIDPYAGLLISRHRTGLFRARYGTTERPPPPPARELTPAIQAFVRHNEARQDAMLATIDRAAFEFNYHLLQVWDFLSLYLCMAGPKESVIGPVPTGRSGETIELSLRALDDETILATPYPFDAETLDVAIVARLLPPDALTDQATFRRAYFGAAPLVQRFRFVGSTPP